MNLGSVAKEGAQSSNLGLLHVLEAMQPSFPVLGGVDVCVERY